MSNKGTKNKHNRSFHTLHSVEFLQDAHASGDFESYVEEHADGLSENVDREKVWKLVCFSKLSEAFIRRNWTRVSWPLVSEFSDLSEDFINEFICFVDFEKISSYQLLSNEFVYKHRYSLNWSSLMFKQVFPEKMLLELINDPYVNIDIGEVLGSQDISIGVATKLRERYRKEEIERNLKLRKEQNTQMISGPIEESDVDIPVLIERNRNESYCAI